MARFLTLVSLLVAIVVFQWVWDTLPHLQGVFFVVALAALAGSWSGCPDPKAPPPSGVAS